MNTRIARSLPEARKILGQVKLPVVVCPAFSVGEGPKGTTTDAEFNSAVLRGLDESATAEVLIEPAQIA
jgi:carbamoylphosphate synthase large subunit